MTNDGTPKDDVKVPEGSLGEEIQAAFDDGKDLLVTIISAMAEEQVRNYLITMRGYTNVFCIGHLLEGGPEGCLNYFSP